MQLIFKLISKVTYPATQASQISELATNQIRLSGISA